MSKNPKAPPPKGQRSIASFVFKKETQPDVHVDLASESAPAASVPPPSTNTDDDVINLIDEEDLPRSKRVRQEKNNIAAAKKISAAALAKPKTSTRTPLVEAEARHQRWQSKLVGDESAGMQRIRTQEALENRKDCAGISAATAAAAATASTSSQKMTPLELQVAALQRQHSDCVLCIECGYKYRFFGKDAEIASAVLGIFSYPDRYYLTAAVPTYTVDRHVRRLVLAGHKVGVVRQTESAAIKAAGDSRNKPFERKLAAVYTRATLEAGALAAGRPLTAAARANAGEHEDEDDEGTNSTLAAGKRGDASYGNEHNSAFLLCIIEGGTGSDTSASTLITNTTEIGLVALEISTGEVYYSEFSDSPMRSELESKLMFTHPSEMLLVTPLSSPTRRLLEAYGSSGTSSTHGPVRTESVSRLAYSSGGALSSVVEFYEQRGTLSTSASSPFSGLDAVMKLPPLVVRALAHALDHVRPFGLESILCLGASFHEFSHVQELSLSPNALAQLEILRNSDDGKEGGSLLWLMDRTLTAAGARLIRRWVSRPLRDVEMIDQRLDAVEEMVNNTECRILNSLPGVLKELPDVERIVGRVLHTTSSPPEFLTLLRVFRDLYLKLGLQANLDALHAAVVDYSTGTRGGTKDQQHDKDIVDEVEEERKNINIPLVSISATEVSSALLRKELIAAADLRCAAVAQAIISSLDIDAAAAGDKLKLFADPVQFPDVEERRAAVVAVEIELDTLRPQLAQALNIKAVNYVSISNQGDYLVEIPVELEKRAPKSWEKVSSTKKAVRFRPPEVKKCLSELVLAKEHLAITAHKAWIRLQTDFSEHYIAFFQRAGRALATLDCLHSFAALAAGSARSYVRPKFVDSAAPPQLHITEGRHPVLDVLLEGSFVPNDIHLEGSGAGGNGGDSTPNVEGQEQQNEKERCAVITGPNMGGKSCYIRQAALIACMAQAGSFVPATACHLSALNAVYTRMGASDNLALGRSTFLEELGEASTILANATPYSLVIFDELGRGTSTRDGKAIAAATLDYVCRTIQCLTLFVTHYPEVALQSKERKGMGSYYMAHVVENKEGNEEKVGGKLNNVVAVPKVTFLYKAVRGVAEASYGLNVARMAGLSENVVMKAAQKAREMAIGVVCQDTVARECADADGSVITRVSGNVAAKLREIERSGDIVDVETVIQLQERVKSALNVA